MADQEQSGSLEFTDLVDSSGTVIGVPADQVEAYKALGLSAPGSQEPAQPVKKTAAKKAAAKQ